MIYTWEQIVNKEGSINKAYLAVDKRKYLRVAHGVYVDDSQYISELEQLFVRYPRATLTLQSAFEHYGLSDYVPDKYYLVTPYNAHTIKDDKVAQSYMDEEMMKIGREKIKTSYGYIYIFDKERLLIELFRLKVKLAKDYFLELISSYRFLKSTNAISMSKVSDYCMKIKGGAKILSEIQVMI